MTTHCEWCRTRPATVLVPLNPIEASSHEMPLCDECSEEVMVALRAVAALRSAGYGLKPLETDV